MTAPKQAGACDTGLLPNDSSLVGSISNSAAYLAGQGIAIDWKQVALEAWLAPSWREAAVEYHKDRPTTALASPGRSKSLLPSDREIWRAAGQCIRRKAPRDSLRTFLKWCDFHGVSRGNALSIFKTIVDKELAK